MGQLEKHQIIDENKLDQRNYFQSLFQEACRVNLLSPSEIERIQLEMVELMGKEIERYTNDESSSIPVEKAQEILQSITFSIGHLLKSTTDMTQKIDILKVEKIKVLFQKGMYTLSASKARAERMLKDLQKSDLKLNSYAYQDTIYTGLPEFFHNYNIEFGANEIPASFDYQLFVAMPELLGIEYIEEYLTRILIEDRFLRRFQTEMINQLLKGFDKDAEQMLDNIFELVLINALGCSLLGQKISDLDIRETQLQYLQNYLEPLGKEELEHKLESALIEMNIELILEHELYAYALTAIPQVASRLILNLHTKTLERLFIAFPTEPLEETIYEDGIPMEDEELRELIEQLQDCQRTCDKIELLKNHVKSMADFTELIDECFYEDEYEEVFQSLSDHDKSLLQNILQLEAGLEYDKDYEPDKLWKKKFYQFGNNI